MTDVTALGFHGMKCSVMTKVMTKESIGPISMLSRPNDRLGQNSTLLEPFYTHKSRYIPEISQERFVASIHCVIRPTNFGGRLFQCSLVVQEALYILDCNMYFYHPLSNFAHSSLLSLLRTYAIVAHRKQLFRFLKLKHTLLHTTFAMSLSHPTITWFFGFP